MECSTPQAPRQLACGKSRDRGLHRDRPGLLTAPRMAAVNHYRWFFNFSLITIPGGAIWPA